MGKKYRRYKNAIEKYLSSEKGRRFFHVTYSVGAAIVIIGALFKINHYRFGTEILFAGMVTEAFIFALSAFDRPSKDYKWEEVYPVLGGEPDKGDSGFVTDAGELYATGPRIQSTTGGGGGGGTVIIGGSGGGSGTAATGGVAASSGTASGGSGVIGGVVGGTFIGGGGGSPIIDPTDSNAVEASEKYAEQLEKASENMEKFAEVTSSLAKMSDTLLESFKSITDNSEGLGNNTKGYVTQMESLNRNLSGLNTIYEIQLKGVSGQINTIEHINAGLDRIKRLYDGSLADSAIFKNETEKMAQHLAELNRVYARLLQAMTVNMNMNLGGGFNNPNFQNPNPQQGETK